MQRKRVIFRAISPLLPLNEINVGLNGSLGNIKNQKHLRVPITSIRSGMALTGELQLLLLTK